MTSPSTVVQAIDEARSRWQNVAPSLRALKRYFGVTDQQLADALGQGLTRQTIQNRLSGSPDVTYWELAGLSAFFEVPEGVLFLGPDAAMRWVLDHPSDDRALKSRKCAGFWTRQLEPALAVSA